MVNAVAQHDTDPECSQETLLILTFHEAGEVRWRAVLGLGHLARIHGAVDHSTVVPRLAELRADSAVGGSVDDAMDDIEMFTR
ncbi:hypothetical protein GCM10027440_21020 [Nocardiopsis coralliicola]